MKTVWLSSVAGVLGLVGLCSSEAFALDRQLLGGARLGLAIARGPRGGAGPMVELHGGYGLNDAFTLYAVGGYGLGFPDDPHSPRHGAWVAAGLTYAFDYLRVVPTVSVGLRGDLLAPPYEGWITPSAEARVGLVWMLERYRAVELDLGYAIHFYQREWSPDVFSVTVGYRFLRDL